MEAIKKLLNELVVGDITLYEGIEPLIAECEKLTNGDEDKFRKCLVQSLYSAMYTVENLEIPPGIKPVESHSLDPRFKFVKVRL